MWFLFRDSPTTRTAGRYYFSPPGTPFYAGTHLLGSRTWHDANWKHRQALGESLTAAHQWSDGRPPLVLPEVHTVGSDDCLLNGELLEQAEDPAGIINGFPPDCFTKVQLADPAWQDASAIEQCPVQRVWARVLVWQYADDETSITNFLRLWLGDNFTITHVPETLVFPRLTILVAPKWTVVVADGTRSFQQLALQAWSSLTFPMSFGGFSTAEFWYDASQYIHSHLVAAGMNAIAPILFVGHSYGAAAVSVLAATYRFANAMRTIVLLTFGIPKPGDSRLVDLMDSCRQVHVQNDTDLVCILPPDQQTKLLLSAIVGNAVLSLWIGWERTSLPFRMDASGRITRAYVELPDLVTLAGYVVQAINGIPLATIIGHRMTEYMNRIQLRCPNEEWPITKDESDDLDYSYSTPGELAWTSSRFPDGRMRLKFPYALPMADLKLSAQLVPQGALRIGEGAPIAYGPSLRIADIRSYPPPNDSCPNAFPLTLGVELTWWTAQGGPAWFSLTTPAGINYTVYVSVLDGFLDIVGIWNGADCSSLAPLFSVMGPYPASLGFNAPTSGIILFATGGPLVSDGIFTIRVTQP